MCVSVGRMQEGEGSCRSAPAGAGGGTAETYFSNEAYLLEGKLRQSDTKSKRLISLLYSKADIISKLA